MTSEKPTTDRADDGALPGPVLPDLSHEKNKPVLHIGTAGEHLDDDDLAIDDEELPVMGTDGNRIP